MQESLDQVDLGKKSKSNYPIKRAGSSFQSPPLSRQVSHALTKKVKDSNDKNSVDKESSTKENTPKLELASQISQSLHSSASTTEKPAMTEAELDQKLKDFAGATGEVDENMANFVGKLLVKEEDEDVNPDKETYKRLWALLGGPIPIAIYIVWAQG